MKVKLIAYIILPLLLLGCKTKGIHTFDIEQANQDIKTAIGIDLLKYKAKVDRKFPSSSFYEDLVLEISVNNKSAIFDSFGSINTYDNGDSIRPEKAGQLTATIAHILADNLITYNCVNARQFNKYCKYKEQYKKHLESIQGSWTMTPTNSYEELSAAYKKEFLNPDELAYMCIVFHLFKSLNDLEFEMIK